MPSFIQQYIEQIGAKSERFRGCFAGQPQNLVEQSVRDGLVARWQPLPDGPESKPRRTFAVDGASGSRPLSNGASFLVAQSLVVGPETEESMVVVEVVRGGDTRNAERLVDHMRQYCEAAVATRCLDRMAGGMLLVDGSLLADMSHILALGPMRLADGTDLRGLLVNVFFDLVEGCCARDILLVGIAKTARDTLLHPGLAEDPGPTARLCDAEILMRFGGGAPGFTPPMLFGSAAVQVAWDKSAPGLRQRAEALPCIAVMYARLAGGEDAVRVDVVGSAIGRAETLFGLTRAWGCAEEAAPIVRRLMAQHGGPNVYNAPLYGVDRMVRLSGKTMDGAYMAMLREATGAKAETDRGARRFTG
ncbi:MAG TPA: DNA double-strand break repair nuclease NurA [Armatimonadota bacterium]|jgi:hypothetical protein